MLKDKYRFSFTSSQSECLKHTLDKMFAAYGQTKNIELQLPLAVIMEFQKRLVGAVLFPKPSVKVYFKSTEALAFQLLYMSHLMDFTLETQEISHQIHRTL